LNLESDAVVLGKDNLKFLRRRRVKDVILFVKMKYSCLKETQRTMKKRILKIIPSNPPLEKGGRGALKDIFR